MAHSRADMIVDIGIVAGRQLPRRQAPDDGTADSERSDGHRSRAVFTAASRL